MVALRRRLVRALALLGVAALTVSLATPDASATMDADRFWAGQIYSGEFGAPSILVVGNTYYAYATNTDGIKLPMMISHDLITWRAHAAWPVSDGYSTWSGYNDALVRTAPWAVYSGGKTSVWAPSVARVGSHYVDAYVVPVPSATQRRWITIATSDSPLGPFRDRTSKPIVCVCASPTRPGTRGTSAIRRTTAVSTLRTGATSDACTLRRSRSTPADCCTSGLSTHHDARAVARPGRRFCQTLSVVSDAWTW